MRKRKRNLADDYREKAKALTAINGFPEEVNFSFLYADNEEGIVRLIKQYLRTPEQKELLHQLDLTIEDCLNGRYNMNLAHVINGIYKQWNEKMGYQSFGSNCDPNDLLRAIEKNLKGLS